MFYIPTFIMLVNDLDFTAVLFTCIYNIYTDFEHVAMFMNFYLK